METTSCKFFSYQNIRETTETVASKIKLFFQNNYMEIVKGATAWTVVFLGTGILWGFRVRAVPFAIYTAYGTGAGLVLTGIYLCIKRSNTDHETMYSWLSRNSQKFSGIGYGFLCAIVTGLFMAIFLSAPQVFGCIVGLLIGDYFMTRIILQPTSVDASTDPVAS